MATRWNHLPPKGTKPVERHKITLRRDGRDWNGNWEIDENRLLVSSAYGSRSELAGVPEGRAARAEALLAEIIGR